MAKNQGPFVQVCDGISSIAACALRDRVARRDSTRDVEFQRFQRGFTSSLPEGKQWKVRKFHGKHICFTASPELPAKFIHWGWLFLGPSTLDHSWWFVWSSKVTPLKNAYCVLSICTHVAVELSLTPRWNFVWNLGLWIIIVVTITMGRVSGAKACRELDWMACGLELFSVMTSVVWSDVIPFARAQRCQKSVRWFPLRALFPPRFTRNAQWWQWLQSCYCNSVVLCCRMLIACNVIHVCACDCRIWCIWGYMTLYDVFDVVMWWWHAVW